MGGKGYICMAVLGILAFLPLLPYINYLTTVKYMKHCVFCDIINGKMPETNIELQTAEFVIFKDIKPASTYHYLAVSKQHYDSLNSLKKNDISLVDRMEAGLKTLLRSKDIHLNETLLGFHLPPYISVKHLHMHGIAPTSDMSFKNRFVFKTGSMWFKTPDESRKYIEDKS